MNQITLTMEERKIDTLINLIKKGEEEKAIDMINENRMATKGMPNTEVLEIESDGKGMTALMWSIFLEKDIITKFLIPISNLSAISHDNMSTIGYAFLIGNTAHIRMIYKYMDEKQRNLFFLPNNSGHTPIDFILQHMDKSKTILDEQKQK